MVQPDEEASLRLRVTARTTLADGVILLRLADRKGRALPGWAPGAHIDLELDPTLVRQYSLCGPADDPYVWEVAVQLEPDGRGGSIRIFDEMTVGAEVTGRGPRNHFALLPSPCYRFIAGGIGITPIRAMVEAAARAGADWRLLYGGRQLATMAFVDDLRQRGADRVVLHPQDSHGLLDLPAAIGEPEPDTLVYCCGPEPLLRAVEAFRPRWPPDAIRVERFAPRPVTEGTGLDRFDVKLARTGRTIEVAPDISILEAIRAAGLFVPSSCSEGTCGTCETVVLDGVPDHRDSVLSDSERESNDLMFICVSRSRTPKLVLDL